MYSMYRTGPGSEGAGALSIVSSQIRYYGYPPTHFRCHTIIQVMSWVVSRQPVAAIIRYTIYRLFVWHSCQVQ